MIIFLHGISAGYSTYVPIIGLLGSLILFIVATPILVYYPKIGLYIGLFSCLLILPFTAVVVKGTFDDYKFNLGLLLLVPSLLLLISLYFTIKYLTNKDLILRGLPESSALKVILSGIPILIFVIYMFETWEFWSWEIFNL